MVQGLVWAVSGQVHPENLLQTNWSAVPQTLPVLSLAFVYQNVVPVVCSRLEVSQNSSQYLSFAVNGLQLSVQCSKGGI